MTLETWELLSYIVTVVALPFAIGVFLAEQRKARANEQEATWQQISEAYIDFLEVVLANPDLKLRSQLATPDLTDEQRERMLLIFDMLISLFERAYPLVYAPDMDEKKQPAGIPGRTTCASGADARTSANACHNCCAGKTRTSPATCSGWRTRKRRACRLTDRVARTPARSSQLAVGRHSGDRCWSQQGLGVPLAPTGGC